MKQKNGSDIVYVPMVCDFIHLGHINIILKAKRLGTIVVGLMSDEAVMRYKKKPFWKYKDRLFMIQNVKGVSRVVKQEDDDYVSIIRKLKPKFFVHGDDWKIGVQAYKRTRVIKVMKEWSGVVVEPKYTGGISSTFIKRNIDDFHLE